MEIKTYKNEEEAYKAISMLKKMAEEMSVFIHSGSEYHNADIFAFYYDENGNIQQTKYETP